MANYYGKVRTNYFAIKDENKFKELTDKLVSESEILVEQNYEGKWSIASYSEIDYCVELYDEDDADYDLYKFFEEMKECIADNDAMIFMEIGNENLRYFIAYCTIVTSKDIQSVNLRDEALKLAATMLGVESFNTEMDY